MNKHLREEFLTNREVSMNDFHSTDPRKYWKTVKMLVKDFSASENPIPPLINNNNETAVSDSEKANFLNDFFVSISNVDDSNTQLPEFTTKCDTSISDISISEQDVSDILKNLATNKACGADGISHRMLKGCSTTISKPLCYLFNKSLTHTIFPSSWKVANVMPLFKKGDKAAPANYKPISLISCIGKVMEIIMFKHIYNHLHSHNSFINIKLVSYQVIRLFINLLKYIITFVRH